MPADEHVPRAGSKLRIHQPREWAEGDMTAHFPSRHIGAPRKFGRKQGIAEIDRLPSIAEDDAFDPTATWVIA
jgi:hypothetical protein